MQTGTHSQDVSSGNNTGRTMQSNQKGTMPFVCLTYIQCQVSMEVDTGATKYQKTPGDC